jgi:hypothetical protein
LSCNTVCSEVGTGNRMAISSIQISRYFWWNAFQYAFNRARLVVPPVDDLDM